MKYSDEQKYGALVRLHNEEEPKSVADAMELPLATVLRWNREFKHAVDMGTVSELIDVDKVLIKQLEGELNSVLPGASSLSAKVDGLAVLDEKMQATALELAKKIGVFAAKADGPSELVDLTAALAKLREAFFAKGPQVAVQQNFGGGGKYGEFLGD